MVRSKCIACALGRRLGGRGASGGIKMPLLAYPRAGKAKAKIDRAARPPQGCQGAPKGYADKVPLEDEAREYFEAWSSATGS